MSKESANDGISITSDHLSIANKINEMGSTEELSLLNSIVEAVMRGDMNQVVTLALSHKSSDQKVKNMVDQALSSAISNKNRLNEEKDNKICTDDSDIYSNNILKSIEEIEVVDSTVSKSPELINPECTESCITSQNVIYSQASQSVSKEQISEDPCTYYFANESANSSNCTNLDSHTNANFYCQSGYATHHTDLDNHPEVSINNSLSQYQNTNSLPNVETINTLSMSQQSVQVQLPGIGNFLFQIPSNYKPGEPITLPLNLPLTSVSQTPGVKPISIHMNTGQLMSNQLLSLYNPSSNVNMKAGKKMRAIAPKPSKPAYRQPLIAPKTSSPNTSVNQENSSINSTPLPAPSGPGRRKDNKGKRSGRKRGVAAKSHKNSSYASSTHSMDSQDASQFNETNNSIKQQNCSHPISVCSTYQCNYFVNSNSSDYLSQSHAQMSQSFPEINSNTLLDNADSGEKDLLSLAWEISNAELGNSDDFTTAYYLYDANNLESDGFVSSEILDQFLQNIQKEDMSDLNRGSSTQINMNSSRVSYASSFTTLPPCSTVLPSVTSTTTYLNNYSDNSSNIQLPSCIEIAEVVNLNTEDMLSELEKEENALLDKFVAHYGTSHHNHPAENIRCDSQIIVPSSSSSYQNPSELNKNSESTHSHMNLPDDNNDKEIDLNTKECNELSEIAKQIEISCNSSQNHLHSHNHDHRNNSDGEQIGLKSKNYDIIHDQKDNKINSFSKITIENSVLQPNLNNNLYTNASTNFCTIPNTSLELIYSSNIIDKNASLIDEKSQNLLNLNVKQRTREASLFVATDSSLESKTLEDFGLFEFCTDGEFSMNMRTLNQDSINADDNQYIEPPILEDISDASPIQSDNETEDEDIDELAFKFSLFNYKIDQSCHVSNDQLMRCDKLYYSDLLKDLPDFDNLKCTSFSIDGTVKKSNHDLLLGSWYQGESKIEMTDIFSSGTNFEKLNEENFNEQKDNVNYLLNTGDTENCDGICNTLLNADHEDSQTKMRNNLDVNNSEFSEINENIEVLTDCITNQESNQCTSDTEILNEKEIVESMNCIKTDIPILTKDTQCLKTHKSKSKKNKRKSPLHVISKEKFNVSERQKNKIMENQNDEIHNDFKLTSQEKDKESHSEKVASLNNIHNRERRLRKPPKKLAIYQSIKFIEQDFIPENFKHGAKPKKIIKILNNQETISEFKRCTRSKGAILKSFDSYYEAISRHHKISGKKINHKYLQNKSPTYDILSKAKSINEKSTNRSNADEDCDGEIKDTFISTQHNFDIDNNQKKYKSEGNLESVIPLSDNCSKRDDKNSHIFLKRYNLRKNIPSIENEEKSYEEVQLDHINSNSKLSKGKCKVEGNSCDKDLKATVFNSAMETKNKSCEKKNLSKFDSTPCSPCNVQIPVNIPKIVDYKDEYESIDCQLNLVEYQILSPQVASFHQPISQPSVDIGIILTANIEQNKTFDKNDNIDSKVNIKTKTNSVRKINKIFRKLSEIELKRNDKDVKYASITGVAFSEIPIKFQFHTQLPQISVIPDLETYESQTNLLIPDSSFMIVNNQNLSVKDELPNFSDTDDVESLDAPLVIVEIDEVSDSNLRRDIVNDSDPKLVLNESTNQECAGQSFIETRIEQSKEIIFSEYDNNLSENEVNNNNEIEVHANQLFQSDVSVIQLEDLSASSELKDQSTNDKSKSIEEEKNSVIGNYSNIMQNEDKDLGLVSTLENPLNVKKNGENISIKTGKINSSKNEIKVEKSENVALSMERQRKSTKSCGLVTELVKSSNLLNSYSLRPKCQFNSKSKNIKKKKKKRKSQIVNSLLQSKQGTELKKNYNITNDIISKINLRNPVCAIEKLSHNDLIAVNLCTSPPSLSNFDSNIDNSHSAKKTNLKSKLLDVPSDKTEISRDESNIIVDKNLHFRIVKKKIVSALKRKNRKRLNKYKIIKKSIWRQHLSRISNHKSKSKRNIVKCCPSSYEDSLSNLDKNVKLIEEGIAQIIIQSKDYPSACVDKTNHDEDENDDESINVGSDSPVNHFDSYLDSNNIETFSRNYGSFSLKIKVQKKEPLVSLEDINSESKKNKKSSKKHKKMRHHFSCNITESDDKKLKSLENLENETFGTNHDKKHKSRKRKYSLRHNEHSSENYNSGYIIPEKLDNDDRPPQLSPETVVNEENQYQKPIKIKLFKSSKSEDVGGVKSIDNSFHFDKVVFLLKKTEATSEKKDCTKSANQKILQIVQEIPSKTCRQAANLAKKKIFSTAKEDRRSQNATLTSIWNSKKPANGTIKTSSDILTMYQNDRCKRPRGRPPKLGQSLFMLEKQGSSTGTLKLKIKLSKHCKNFNNDNNLSNGDNSGRASTNDSSILNSAVGGIISGPADESHNFINSITEHLDQSIEYLEAKEAKVYFDPNQVDIERMKNSYYSSKKVMNSESFTNESHQNLYENSMIDSSTKKSDIISSNRNYSEYANLDSTEPNNLYSTNLSKEENNSSNSSKSNKMSHLSKESINMSGHCYQNIITNRDTQGLSQTNQSFQYESQLASGKNSPDVWQQKSKTTNPVDPLTPCRNNTESWFSEHRNMRDSSFNSSSNILYNSYNMASSPVKESKNCISQNQNPPFEVHESETSESKILQQSPSKQNVSGENRKSGSNSFSLNESHNQLSPHCVRSAVGTVPSQLNIPPWSDDPNHNASLNHTAAAWMTYAQQQAAAAAYMDPQMKAYYNLALSQSMLNNPYCGSYGNPTANSENFYSSLHSQYLNNSKDTNEKIITNGTIRNHSDPMESFMEAAQMSSWEQFYSAAAMAGYHNSSQGAMEDYSGRAGNMLQAHHMLSNGYPVSILGRDHFALDSNKPPLAHQNQSGSSSPIKFTATGSTPVSSSQAYSHVQMPYNHFGGTAVGFF